MRTTTFTLNGQVCTASSHPGTSLRDVLRAQGCFSVRFGSDDGSTGAATVLLDGVPVSADVVLAEQVSGRSVETVEGLEGPNGELHPIQQAFMVTGAYGKPVAKQMGAPLRLHLPWKYGFKSIKSVVKVTFTDKRPKGLWEALQAREYGFWANVNPEVAHPRWSQATEEVIGTGGKRVPTLLWNGYGEFVADMYKGLPASEKLYV